MKKTIYSIQLANIIKDLRTKKGYTIEYVAKKIGVSPKTIQKAESGYDITFCEAFALAELYEIKFYELISMVKNKIDGN